MKRCPEKRDQFCPACSRARRVVDWIDAIMQCRIDTCATVVESDPLAWCAVRLGRFLSMRRMEAARAGAYKEYDPIPDKYHVRRLGPRCFGTSCTQMGSDSYGTEKDIDANGWYSNVRREYEDCRET